MSFGWMSSEEDVHAILTFLRTCFLGTADRQNPSGHNALGHSLHGHNLHGQNPQGQNPTTALAAPMKGNHKGHSRSRHNLSRHNPTGPNPGGHNPGVQDPTFSLNAHCSTAIPSAADPNHPSPIHSTARNTSNTPQAQAPRQHRQHTQVSSQPLYDSMVGDKTSLLSVGSQQPQAVSRTHILSDAELRTSAQEVAVQQSEGSAWLRQLPWVRCGDIVTAWKALQDESQRLTSPSQSLIGVQCRGQPRGQLEGQPGGQLKGQCEGQHRGQLEGQYAGQPGGPHGPLPGGQFLDTSSSPCTSSHQSAHSASQSAPESDSESASLSVLPPDFQHDSDSHPVPSSLHHSESQQGCSQGSLEGIWVYPIKSCGGMRVPEWPLGPNGLLLDREWALVGDDGHVLTQKGLPQLALLQPRVDLGQGFMQVRLAYIGTADCLEFSCCKMSSNC